MNELFAWFLFAVVAGLPLFAGASARAATNDGTYDENDVPAYRLPNPLRAEDGTAVDDVATWRTERRPELLRVFQQHVYGTTPSTPVTLHGDVVEENPCALEGRALRRQIRLTLSRISGGRRKQHTIDVIVYVPRADRPVATFVGFNFQGNHTIHPDSAIRIPTTWMRPGPGVVDHQATEEGRGIAQSRWPIERIVQSGFGIATAYYGDIDPDFHDGFKNGVHELLSDGHPDERNSPHAWASISAWAWGLSRITDYLQTVPEIDGQQLMVFGHSRLGKAALWAAAQDERFAMAISNNSGCGGAAISRRRFGETVAAINTSFPHWFCRQFHEYNNREESLPVDQHMLVALIAPRPVYVASASEDLWADPKGELTAAVAAHPVYRLHGKAGLGESTVARLLAQDNSGQITQADLLQSTTLSQLTLPPLNHPVGDTLRYHIREGRHDITEYDWLQYIRFAEKHLP